MKNMTAIDSLIDQLVSDFLRERETEIVTEAKQQDILDATQRLENEGLTNRFWKAFNINSKLYHNKLQRLGASEKESVAYAGKVSEVLIPDVLKHVPKSVHDVPVYVTYRIKDNAAYGKWNGVYAIFVQPGARAWILWYLLHEIKHAIDEGKKGKEVLKDPDLSTIDNFRAYQSHPSERRAEAFAKRVIMHTAPNKKRNPALTEDIRLMISEGTSIHKIGDDFVDGLSRDLSTLLKNVPKIKKADDIKKFFKAMNRFENYIEMLLNPHSVFVNNFNTRDFLGYADTRVKPPLKNLFHKLNKGDQFKQFSNYYMESLRDFLAELRPDMWWVSYFKDSDHLAESSWEEGKDEWKRKVQRKARKLWKNLKNAFRAFDLEGKRIGVPNEEVEEIHGHPVVVIGYDPDDKKHDELMKGVVQGIKQAKKIVTKRFPTLLPRNLLIIINFDIESSIGGKYWQYFDKNTSAIEISPLSGDPTRIQSIIIHEAAHYYWNFKLSESARQFWTKVYEANMSGRLDLKKLKKYWDKNPNMEYIEQVINFTSMKVKDPQLYLQLQYLIFKQNVIGFDIRKREDLERAIKNKKVWIVPKQPVTWYAGEDAEEMFCESVATYLGFGSKAMPDYILAILKDVIGSPLKESYQVEGKLPRFQSIQSKFSKTFDVDSNLYRNKFQFLGDNEDV